MPKAGSARELFDIVAADYLGKNSAVSRRRMFSSDGLEVNGKFFAFLGRDGRLIVKLPAVQAVAFINEGGVQRVKMGSRTMREWVGAPAPGPSEPPDLWQRLMADAHCYVAKLTSND